MAKIKIDWSGKTPKEMTGLFERSKGVFNKKKAKDVTPQMMTDYIEEKFFPKVK